MSTDVEQKVINMSSTGQTLGYGAAGFLFLNVIVKKERHGRTMTAALKHITHSTEEPTDTLHKTC